MTLGDAMPNLLEPTETLATIHQLLSCIGGYSSCVIAFSGGVDSSVIAKAAFEALGDRSVAITGVGPSVSQEDIRCATLVAKAIGIRHLLLETSEIVDPSYLANDARRCFYCKSNLYARLGSWAKENGFACIFSGTNADDLSDYRPGLDAARDFQVIAPLAELHIGKATIRSLAAHWQLPVADRPASPCLASRIAYGEAVTVEKLGQIESAERWLAERNFHDVRVRLHPGALARIEVSSSELERLVQTDLRRELVDYFQQIGFQFVTIDASGRMSGSLNKLLPMIQ